ncbi:hypothetical protein TWF696_002862 [Orbilia brochopaga]|uniref:Tubulin alpha chain n=1 Tax=Orbilia brochopaga TaxID=3140254 RepID=A0AAV9U0W1_9PEZI
MTPESCHIHIGQAGVRLGHSTWELYSLEQNIGSDGRNNDANPDDPWDLPPSTTLFYERETGKYVPRSIFIDPDPSSIDEIRNGTFKSLFPPEQLLSGNESTSGNFAHGYHGVDKQLINTARDQLRRLAENCSNLQGLFVSHSLGGGTGSGLGALFAEKIAEDFPKKSKFQLAIYPSLQDQDPANTFEPYNAVLSTHRFGNIAK